MFDIILVLLRKNSIHLTYISSLVFAKISLLKSDLVNDCLPGFVAEIQITLF